MADMDHRITAQMALEITDHLVDLIPDESLAAHPLFSPLVLNLNKFKSVVLFSSRGTVLYLLLY